MKFNTTRSTNSCTVIHSFFFKVLITIAILTANNAFSQRIKVPTIFEKTDKLIQEKKLGQAYSMIKRYQESNPDDFNATWKAAKVAYWNWDIENSKLYYDAAIKLDETNYDLKYDYAEMLFAIGDYSEAAEIFKQYRTLYPNFLAAWAYNVKAFYYNNDLAPALDLYSQMPENVLANQELIAIKNNILERKALNISFSGSFVDDNQPMKTVTPKLRISKMHSAYVNWYVEGSYNDFSNDTLKSNAQNFRIGNKFTFRKLNLVADVSLGATVLARANEIGIIGGLLLSQNLGSGFSLNAELTRNPYYYSLPSTTNFVIQDNLGIALSISDLEKFSGNIQFQNQMFNDANTISATSLWFLSPGIGKGKIKVKIGYAYEGMKSKKDNFTSVKTLAQLIEDFDAATPIKGVYMSYFTPQNQVIHSALATVEFKLTPKFDINLTGSYGVSAKWDNPFLYLNEDSAGQVFIDKDFITSKFSPATYKVDLNYVLSQKFNMGLHYDYFKTAFFTANTFMLNLNYKIISEK